MESVGETVREIHIPYGSVFGAELFREKTNKNVGNSRSLASMSKQVQNHSLVFVLDKNSNRQLRIMPEVALVAIRVVWRLKFIF